MKRKKTWGLAGKLNGLVIIILLVISLNIAFVIRRQVRNGVEEFAVEKASTDLELAYNMLDRTYPGEWQEVNGELYKGTVKVSGNDEMVDGIADLTHGSVTIFLQDKRAATSVMLENGERATDTQASEAVSQKVLNNGENYFGEANVAGSLTQAAYMPIRDQEGTIIGMWFVGVSKEFIDHIIVDIIVSLAAVLVIGIVFSVLIFFWFTKRIKKRLDLINRALERAGAGDFTVTLADTANDEFGQVSQNFNKMKEKLSGSLHKVTLSSGKVNRYSDDLSQAAQEVNEGTEQVAVTMQEMASGAESQAHSASDLSMVMEKFNEIVRDSSLNGERMSKSSNDVLERTSKGKQLMDESIVQMKTIDQIVQESVRKVNGLDSQTQEISTLISVIESIANQTNLLALNAAIEAARAGEQGKGFAVVADEVRKLAEQVGGSVKEITEIVKNIQKESENVVQTLEGGYAEVEKGTEQIKMTGDTFKKIDLAVRGMAGNLQKVNTNLSEMVNGSETLYMSVDAIASTSEEAAAGIEETSASSQEISSSMEEITSSSQELSAIAEELNDLVSQFQL